MKQILRLGEVLRTIRNLAYNQKHALNGPQHRKKEDFNRQVTSITRKNWPKIILLLIMFCSCVTVQAQIGNKSSMPKSKSQDSILRLNRQAMRDSLIAASVSRLHVPHGGIVLGDSLPEEFWDLHLKVVNNLKNSDWIYMKNFKGKLLILDFWATYCTPCIRSVDALNNLQQQFEKEIVVLPIHLFDYEYKVLPFVKKMGWKVPIALGKGDSVLNKLFFAHQNFGQVWIMDGKLLAIPQNREATKENIVRILMNQPYRLEMDDYMTYFDKRYTGKDIESKPKNQTK